MCDDKKVAILRLGKMTNVNDEFPIEIKRLGLIRSEKKMVEIYNATDMFILPSLEDNLPYTMIESMSCGTPVVGFDTGGISDTVDKDCGILVSPRDSNALAKGILEFVFDDEKRLQMGGNSRKKIETTYTYGIQSKNYIKLYKELLANVAA